MHRIYNLLILLSFFLCYINYGKADMGFIGTTELYLLIDFSSWTDLITSVLLFPMLAGQIILLVAIFKPQPNRKLTVTGSALLGISVLAIFLFGVILSVTSAIFSTLPYFIFSIIGIAKVHTVVKNDFEIE